MAFHRAGQTLRRRRRAAAGAAGAAGNARRELLEPRALRVRPLVDFLLPAMYLS